jgi:AcrR family transcriptional regulator
VAQQRRARETRAAIVQGASSVFLARGYAETSLDQVTDAAGVTKGALYFHFRSKADLAGAVVAEQQRLSQAWTELAIAGAPSAAGALMLACASFATQLSTEPMVAAGLRLSTESIGEVPSRAPSALAWVDETAGHVGRAVAEGTFRDDLDVDRAARFVVGAFSGVQTFSALSTGHADVFERLQDMMHFVLPSFLSPRSAGLADELAALIRPTDRPPID